MADQGLAPQTGKTIGDLEYADITCLAKDHIYPHSELVA